MTMPDKAPNLITIKKMYYSISEVCAMTGLEPHILRYWEEEFSKLRPKRNSADKRAYREKDIELINEIKRLLHDEKMTLDGAKKKIADDRRNIRAASGAPSRPTTRSMPVIPSKPATKRMPVVTPPPISIPLPEGQSMQAAPLIPTDIISDIRKELSDVLSLLEA